MASILGRRFNSPISTPGRRLLRYVPLRFLRGRRGGRAGRKLDFELPLVSFVDCLLCLILFLLGSFSADAECAEREHVPSAHNTQTMVEAPLVSITPRQILVDSSPAADTEAIAAAGRLTRIDALFNRLKSERELWRQLHPGQAFPGIVVLQVDRRVPALVVKSAFQTAAYAGYPNVSFMVEQR